MPYEVWKMITAYTPPCPKIIDDDRDEIRAEVGGQSIRSWEYHSEQERRVKMLAAREFAEGWYQAMKEREAAE